MVLLTNFWVNHTSTEKKLIFVVILLEAVLINKYKNLPNYLFVAPSSKQEEQSCETYICHYSQSTIYFSLPFFYSKITLPYFQSRSFSCTFMISHSIFLSKSTRCVQWLFHVEKATFSDTGETADKEDGNEKQYTETCWMLHYMTKWGKHIYMYVYTHKIYTWEVNYEQEH